MVPLIVRRDDSRWRLPSAKHQKQRVGVVPKFLLKYPYVHVIMRHDAANKCHRASQ